MLWTNVETGSPGVEVLEDPLATPLVVLEEADDDQAHETDDPCFPRSWPGLDSSPAVPRDAVIYEGDMARVWVARSDKTIEGRQIKTGVTSGNFIQVLQGLQPGEIVVSKGSLFVDQAAGS